MPSNPVTIGIDVAKAHLDVAVRPNGDQWQVANTEEGIAGLVGRLAPLTRDSGTVRGKRLVWDGRGRGRAALYMATLVATRFNPAIRTFYARLLNAGKAKKVTLTACMHTILLLLNTIVRTNVPWRQPESPAAS